MDASRFDALTKTFGTTDTRRAVLRLLAHVPVAAGLTALLGDGPEAAAQQDPERGSSHRRHRRKAKHRHRTGDAKENRKGKRKKKGKRKGKNRSTGPAPQPGCIPESTAQTCNGTCAMVANHCGTLVDCGDCSCDPACGACFTCDPATGDCIVDDTQVGDDCGEPGQVCQVDGSCACDTTSCTAPQTCGGGNPGTPGVCGCTATCDGKACLADDGCGNPCTTGSCSSSGQVCTADGCRACGDFGQVCCANNGCEFRLVCSGGFCLI